MHFSPIATALAIAAIAQASLASGEVSAQVKSCITVEAIQGSYDGMMLLSKTYNFAFPQEFPDIKVLSGKDPKECVPDSLATAVASVMAKVGIEQDFENKLVEMQAIEVKSTVHAPTLLFKRIRNCPQIKTSSEQKAASTWSCSAASHPGTCNVCTSLAVGGFATAVGICGLKETFAETVGCCANAAFVFLTQYSMVCIEK